MTLLAAALVFAQSGVITGQAIDARTNEPVRRALIIASDSRAREHRTESGPDGRFVFESLPPEDYLLRGERNGYTKHSPKRGWARTLVRAGVPTPPVVVKLTPHAAVEGLLTDDAGDPVEGAQVELRKAGDRQAIAQTLSNDRGEYRLYGLAAGSYRLSAKAPGKTRALYPQVVRLRAGEDLRAVSFSLGRVLAGRISGRVSEAARVELISREDADEAPRSIQTTGSFVLEGVPPGGYWLRAESDDRQRFALLELNLDSRLDDLPVILEPGVTIRGAVNARAKIEFRSVHTRRIQIAKQDTEGAFEVPNAAPDLYRIHVTPSAPDAYIDSIRYNNAEAPSEGIAITGAGGEVQITVGTKGAELIVVVLDDKYHDAPGAHVVLWPTDRSKLQPNRYDEFTVNNNAQAAVRGIAPGEYFVIALDDWEPMGAYWDPARLTALESQAERVKFGAGERVVRYLRIANPAP